MLITESATLDAVLNAHSAALGGDRADYRNHAYRVMNLCLVLSSADDDARRERIAIAAAFHDIGIWTAATFDYIPPSVDLACAHLAAAGRSPWAPEIETTIREHHKLTRYRPNPDWLVEPFRRADLIDVSRGLVTFGLPRALIKDAFAQWPSAGFHKRLVELSLRRLGSHPLSPLPMVKL
jgi:hypothetical protein